MARSLYAWQATAARFPTANHPAGLYASSANFAHMGLAFALNELVNFEGIVPASYVGGDIDIILSWTPGAASSGSATWGARYLGRTDDEVFDVAMSSQNTVVDAVTAVGDLQTATISFTSPALVAGDFLVVEIELTSALTGGDAILRSVEIQEQ